jgi:hypothetical protein
MWLVLALVSALLVVGTLCVPNFVSSGHSKTNVIINNLRQLDGAVQRWALDHHQPDTARLTEQDVAPYLQRHNGWVDSVDSERYTLGSVTQSPQAELTRELGGRPKGTVFRLGTNGDLVIVLPNKQMHRTR